MSAIKNYLHSLKLVDSALEDLNSQDWDLLLLSIHMQLLKTLEDPSQSQRAAQLKDLLERLTMARIHKKKRG